MLFNVADKIIEVVQGSGCREELSEILHEARTVLIDLESLPSIARVLDHLAILFIVISRSVDDLSLVVSIVALLSLGLTLGMSLVINPTLTHSEVLSDLSAAGDRTLHEGMSTDLLHRGTLIGVEGHHLLEEILEFIRVDVFTILCLGMGRPEELGATGGNESVVGIIGFSGGEGRSLSHDDEQDDSCSK